MKNFLLALAATVLLSCNTQQKENASENRLSTKAVIEAKQKAEKQASERNCSERNRTSSLGKGLIIVGSDTVEKSTPLEIFNDSLLRDKYVSWDYYAGGEPNKPVCPKYFQPDYDILHFVYLKETSKSYQILNGFNEIKYLPKSKANEAKSWETYILGSYGIGKYSDHGIGELTDKELTAIEQPFRKAPSENAPIIKFQEDADTFCPIEIKGDWVKVQYDCFESREDNKYEGQPCHDYIQHCKPAQTAWIKWREKNQVLIDILLMP